MKNFTTISLFFVTFSLCFAEPENDPPLPPELVGADERCLVLTCTKSAAFKEEKVRKTLMQKFCPSASPEELFAANGWCSMAVSQMITPNLVISGTTDGINNGSISNGTEAINAVLATMKMFFRLSDHGFWMLIFVPNCGGHMGNVATNVPSIVQRVIR